jgi:hypothetical protein
MLVSALNGARQSLAVVDRGVAMDNEMRKMTKCFDEVWLKNLMETSPGAQRVKFLESTLDGRELAMSTKFWRSMSLVEGVQNPYGSLLGYYRAHDIGTSIGREQLENANFLARLLSVCNDATLAATAALNRTWMEAATKALYVRLEPERRPDLLMLGRVDEPPFFYLKRRNILFADLGMMAGLGFDVRSGCDPNDLRIDFCTCSGPSEHPRISSIVRDMLDKGELWLMEGAKMTRTRGARVGAFSRIILWLTGKHRGRLGARVRDTDETGTTFSFLCAVRDESMLGLAHVLSSCTGVK